MSHDEFRPEIVNPATYAFVGDAVYGLLVRSCLAKVPRPSGQLHTASVGLVSATAQARAMALIEPELSEDEKAIYRRGRNFHTSHSPKNASVGEYHAATGLETLFGYLYLSGQAARLERLFSLIWEEFSATLS